MELFLKTVTSQDRVMTPVIWCKIEWHITGKERWSMEWKIFWITWKTDNKSNDQSETGFWRNIFFWIIFKLLQCLNKIAFRRIKSTSFSLAEKYFSTFSFREQHRQHKTRPKTWVCLKAVAVDSLIAVQEN